MTVTVPLRRTGRDAVVWDAADDAASAPSGSPSWQEACPAADGQDEVGGDLSAAAHDHSASRASRLSYLLRNLVVDRPDHVWCADITYIPMRRGFLYLVAAMADDADIPHVIPAIMDFWMPQRLKQDHRQP